MPVEDVTRTLRHMWDVVPGEKGLAPSDFRASQMTLVLHFGLETTAAEVAERFAAAIAFAQRYPSRIIVLCPARPDENRDLLEAKLFSQCYIGSHQRDLCCCEALILGYSTDESNFLENQVSLWIEADLPVYHWLNRVPAERISGYYLSFIRRCRRVLIDTSIECDALKSVQWPEPDRVRDLAQARILPFRQQIGQFLSSLPVKVICGRGGRLKFSCEDSLVPEVRHLADWIFSCLDDACRKCSGDCRGCSEVGIESGLSAGSGVELCWYDRGGKLVIEGTMVPEEKHGELFCHLDGFRRESQFHLEPLKPEQALAEALFF